MTESCPIDILHHVYVILYIFINTINIIYFLLYNNANLAYIRLHIKKVHIHFFSIYFFFPASNISLYCVIRWLYFLYLYTMSKYYNSFCLPSEIYLLNWSFCVFVFKKTYLYSCKNCMYFKSTQAKYIRLMHDCTLLTFN